MSPLKPPVFRRIASALAAWRRRQQDCRQLLAMGEAELRDLGIGRGQIPALLLEAAPSQGRLGHAAIGPASARLEAMSEARGT